MSHKCRKKSCVPSILVVPLAAATANTSSSSTIINEQRFLVGSSGTITIPAGQTGIVRMWGGGGGGGGTPPGAVTGGGGGGAAGYAEFPVGSGTYPYSVGANGNGVIGAKGDDGTATTFNTVSALG